MATLQMDVQAPSGANAPAGGKENQQPAGLTSAQLAEMYANCLKMASEGKITAKNTWSLKLIDHMAELVKPMDTEGHHINFQRASCTIDAGVKIYTARVEAVWNDAVKILSGGLGAADDEAGGADEAGLDAGEEGGGRARRARRAAADYNPEATLEANPEKLRLQRAELSHASDPLFHRMSAMFDAGGPHGLLLYNLGLSAGCELAFDGAEVPEARLVAAAPPEDVMVDVACLRPALREVQAAADAAAAPRITPTLDELLAMLGRPTGEEAAAGARTALAAALADMPDAPQPAASSASGMQASAAQSAAASGAAASAMDTAEAVDGAAALDDGALAAQVVADSDGDDAGCYADFGDFGEADGYEDEPGQSLDGTAWRDDGSMATQEFSARQAAAGQPTVLAAASGDATSHWLLSDAVGAAVGSDKSWAGAAHWRFRRAAGGASSGVDSGVGHAGADSGASRARKGRAALAPLDMAALPELPAGALALAREADITLKTMQQVNTLLPEDHHYDAGRFARLMQRPHLTISAASAALPPPGGAGGHGGADAWGDDDGDDGAAAGGADFDFDFGGDGGDGSDAGSDGAGMDYVDAPVQVEKTSITYARRAKQVDVKALKDVLRASLLKLARGSGGDAGRAAHLSFHDVLAAIPARNPAGALHDLSVHLCFICVLHLANENGLVIRGTPDLRDLSVGNVNVDVMAGKAIGA